MHVSEKGALRFSLFGRYKTAVAVLPKQQKPTSYEVGLKTRKVSRAFLLKADISCAIRADISCVIRADI